VRIQLAVGGLKPNAVAGTTGCAALAIPRSGDGALCCESQCGVRVSESVPKRAGQVSKPTTMAVYVREFEFDSDLPQPHAHTMNTVFSATANASGYGRIILLEKETTWQIHHSKGECANHARK